jgi:hypothetical protein
MEIVNSICLGSSNPGARIAIIWGEKTIPKMVNAINTVEASVKETSTSSWDSSLVRWTMYSV